MGCCSEDVQFSTMDFSLELYDLVQDPNKNTKFQFKKLESATTEKLFSKQFQLTSTKQKYAKVWEMTLNFL